MTCVGSLKIWVLGQEDHKFYPGGRGGESNSEEVISYEEIYSMDK